jgi:fumarate hydratase class I
MREMRMETITADRIREVAANLLAKAATLYPKNYLDRIVSCFENEEHHISKNVMGSIIENILLGADGFHCLCQDTGIPAFHVYLNPAIAVRGNIDVALTEATIQATEKVPLRKNVVEPFSYANSGNNTGWGTPFVHYHYSPKPGPLRLRVELKGFGGEIKTSVDWVFTSSRNMSNAILAYVLNSVLLSKGEACVPSFLGIGVGGYAAEAVANGKAAVFRELTNKSVRNDSRIGDEFLDQFEQRVFRCVNRLGLGPMGMGGNTTTMGVYVERRGTHTSVSSVSVAHQCWASRGSEALVSEGNVEYVTPHVGREDVPGLREKIAAVQSEPRAGAKVYELETPASMEDVLKLRVGDVVYLSGKVCTARDGAHLRMVESVKSGKAGEIPEELLRHKVIYHCAPVVSTENEKWCANAAGPTTSSRFTDDESFLVEKGILNVAIGKGTMGNKMLEALKGRGVYLNATGGCAITYQQKIENLEPLWLDLGYPEAVWVMDVARFGPLVVNMDSTGNSLTGKVMEHVYENARKIYEEEGLNPHERYAQYPVTFAGLSLEEVISKTRAS